MRQLLRDPLAHFLLAGAVIWGLLSLGGDRVDPAERSITLTREQQAGLALGFERMMGRAPTDTELDGRIEQWLREEVLYREALRLGLDEGDPVVRRRLAAKMDELAGAQAELAQPSEEVLRGWFRENGAAYVTGGALTFEQAWFGTEDAARAALSGGATRGQPISLPRNVDGLSKEDVIRTFGEEFAAELEQLEASPGWQGPIRSGYGWHLVRLISREAGSTPPFEEVREAVERDWRSATIETRRREAFDILRESYAIEVE